MCYSQFFLTKLQTGGNSFFTPERVVVNMMYFAFNLIFFVAASARNGAKLVMLLIFF